MSVTLALQHANKHKTISYIQWQSGLVAMTLIASTKLLCIEHSWMSDLSQVHHLNIQPATLANSASYPQWDSKRVSTMASGSSLSREGVPAIPLAMHHKLHGISTCMLDDPKKGNVHSP